ncbi:squalene synthase HpnC [Gluconobacter kanchanaburiensis]|uniref:Squalene synthase HpnC n=1 Tax=Gluconobacter kanchanaburiensis NBRC 103587 TaxID=1307948 RepID=A0A511BA62_9PROT|nr:squalene synthase HpnC [Gluconobacter kanchanaburiensis]MBF0862520.1 squalene synthase HpnC [Gluconobacter kanchanaburiensis]GBR71748.1 phytoene synthase [Gluconobacter kanchanaburiensis NBRC 103587]GEK96641.1 squalene synthase HpnC [Gluconobacter kanchanaburiensis NBRC 103587]
MTDTLWGTKDVTSAKDKADENFPVGSFLIAPRLRPYVHTYYNFARVADDMVDTTELTPPEKIARLKGMAGVIRGEIEAPQRADAQTAVKLREVLTRTGVPLETATDLLDAFCMDAEKSRYESWGELLHYCCYSANPVGHFLLLLHGEAAETLAPSDALCSALQIVNHLQDVASDLKVLDRCYVPRLWMEEEGVSVDDLRLVRSKPGVRRVFNRMLDGVDALNRQARVLPYLIQDRRMRLEAAVIVELCHILTARLRRQDPLLERVSLTKMDGARALFRSMRHFPAIA